MTAHSEPSISCNPRDQQAVAALPSVRGVFTNTTSWYNNASFVLPLAATLLVGLVGAVSRRSDLLGFAAFLAVVTALMTPVVLAAWRQTPTAVVVTDAEIISLHDGRVLKMLPWIQVRAVRERETQGNRRWEIVGEEGERMLLDGELENLPELVRLSRSLAAQQESL